MPEIAPFDDGEDSSKPTQDMMDDSNEKGDDDSESIRFHFPHLRFLDLREEPEDPFAVGVG